MPDTHVDNLKVGVSGTPGTGTATIGSAASGCRGFVAGDDGKTFSGRWTDGTAWETASGCLYTHSGTTLARGNLLASSTGSRLSLTSAAVFECSPVADLGNRVEQIALQDVTITDAAVTMQVGKRYRGSIAAFTADRTYTLPAVFAAGDMIEMCITEGDDTYELLVTAASGDTLNGVAGGTEWSRVFITGEVVRFRGDVANSAWVVDYDGRIPQEGLMDLTTASDGETASTYFRPTQTSTAGVWTSRLDVGSVVSTANDYMLVRRAGKYQVSLGYAPKDTGTAGTAVNARIILNDTQEETGPSATCTSSGINRCAASKLIPMAVGDYVRYQYRTTDGNLGCAAFRGSFLSIFEVLR